MRSAPHAAPDREMLAALLEEALRRLADAGEVEPACRLAGRAYTVLRRDDPAAARRFDILLHRLTPRLGAGGGAPGDAPAAAPALPRPEGR